MKSKVGHGDVLAKVEDEGRSGGFGSEVDEGFTGKSKSLEVGLDRQSVVLSMSARSIVSPLPRRTFG